MMTKSGVLFLTKAERKALEIVKQHCLADISYGWGGSFGGYEESDKREEKASQKEVIQAKIGLKVIDFVLKMTN